MARPPGGSSWRSRPIIAGSYLWISGRIGAAFKNSQRDRKNDGNDDFDILLGATLTLLALIIGFTFSMAVSRYDQRKNDEEEEANAIGTEYGRASLLPATDVANVRDLLRTYLDQRILHYITRNEQQLGRINAQTERLQSDLWSAVAAPAAAQPSPKIEEPTILARESSSATSHACANG